MKSADEFHQISKELFFWQVYEPEVKADLSCCAISLPQGLVFVDPIPLNQPALEELMEIAKPLAIVLTNGNHERSAQSYRNRFGIPIYASADAGSDLPPYEIVDENSVLFGALRVIALPGFGPGEIALHWGSAQGALIVGDAIVNFGQTQFSLLPEKYCLDQKQGRKSLRKLLELEFQLMTFAHGLPILSGAKSRLEKIL